MRVLNETYPFETRTPGSLMNLREEKKYKILQIKDHNPQIREILLTPESPSDLITFKAGQFLTLKVPVKGQEKPALRAYSLASNDRDPSTIRFLLKAVPGGVATHYIWGAQSGDVLTLTGPFGRVLFATPPTEQVLFLNTGTGVAQHLSFLLSHGGQFPKTQFRMLFGLYDEEEAFYQNELEQLKSQIPNFEFHYVLSRPSSSWKGLKGFVQHHIEPFDCLKKPTQFYLCGNGLMIRETKELLLSQGLSKERIFSEAFH